jgi:hypothetical protein
VLSCAACLLRPLQVDTRWSPEIHKFVPMLNDNTGFEFFTLDFPWTPYPGHFLVSGITHD